MFTKATLKFLDELAANNNRTWFEANKPRYESLVREPALEFIAAMGPLLEKFAPHFRTDPRKMGGSLMRVFRDTRFSRDKTPYKTNFGAIIGPGGWKGSRLGYYISLEPGARSMVAGGLHDPAPEQLNRFRQSIDKDAIAFKKLTRNAVFVKAFGAVEGERLKTAPKGFDREHPEIALLQLKQVTVFHRFSDQEVLGRDFASQVIPLCRAMKPFLNYLDRVIE
jgi:uncharacterized protein (TIGR02453 family)